MIPIPNSNPLTSAILMVTAALFFIILLLPTILELRKPKDAGPRRIFEADGKEIVGFSLLLAVYFREKSSQGAPLFLEDIEPQESDSPHRSFLSLPIPDIEF